VQLAEWQDEFEAAGIKVAGMTYDSQEILAGFVASESLRYPILSDENAQHVNAFGIRNVDYGSDHRFYGIPYPGIVLISPDGKVLGKYAEPGYKKRPPLKMVLASAKAAVGAE